MKIHSTILFIKEIKTSMRHNYWPIEKVKIKGTNNTKCWQGFEAIETLTH